MNAKNQTHSLISSSDRRKLSGTIVSELAIMCEKMRMSKKFYKSRDELKLIAVGYGACLATDHITVEGKKVGYMYREEPLEGMLADNGWRFFSGEESQEYVDDAKNSCFYDTNTIANYDESIIPFLTAPIGSAFGKNDKGEFIEDS